MKIELTLFTQWNANAEWDRYELHVDGTTVAAEEERDDPHWETRVDAIAYMVLKAGGTIEDARTRVSIGSPFRFVNPRLKVVRNTDRG
jgi:hypothetical protein